MASVKVELLLKYCSYIGAAGDRKNELGIYVLVKYMRDIESVNTEKLKFELDQFLELIPDEPKMPNYFTAPGSTASSTSSLI